MLKYLHSNRISLILLVLTSIICWLIQSHTILNWDISYDLLATNRLLEGGTYGEGFFSPNPPLIFYLYMPIVWLKNIFYIKLQDALAIYFIFLAQMSFVICYYFIKKICKTTDLVLANILLGTILLILFILPYHDFGKREHLSLILTLPYFLAISYQLMGTPIHFYQSLFIGLLAAIGFCLKPYFLIVPFLIELFIIIRNRSFFSWIRAIPLVMLAFILVYIAFVYIYFPFYALDLIPFFMHYYHISVANSMSDVLFQPYVLFTFLSLVFFVIFYHKNYYKMLSLVLALGTLGYLIAYLIQHTMWRYHIIHAYLLACLLYALIFSFLKNWLSMFIVGFFMVIFPAREFILEFKGDILYKKEFSSFVKHLSDIVKDKSVYTISSTVELLPAMNYSSFKYVSQFMDFCWFAGFEKERQLNTRLPSISYRINEDYFINKVAEELNTKKPDFVLINKLDNKLFFSYLPFDYLTTFLKNDNFLNAWQPYHYVGRLEDYSLQLYSTSNWGLYIMPEFQDKINLNHISNKFLVVLTGKSNPRTAYYVIHQKYLHSKFGLIKQNVFLTENESKYLANKNGLLSMNADDASLIKNMISKSINAPAHRLDVYQRET